MQTKHLSAVLTFVLTLALLAGCAAPVAAPETTLAPQPAPTPVLPEATVTDSFAIVQAWVDAIYSGDVDAALDLFTDDGKYLVWYTAYGREDMRWVFNWLAGLETKQENFDCQPKDDALACTYTVLDGCMAASGTAGLPVKATFTFQDGKIKEATGYTVAGPEWDTYWAWTRLVGSWENVFRPGVWTSAAEGTKEGGAIRIGICWDYANTVKTQEPATAAAAQGLVNAINSGDTDAALAVFTDDPKFQFWNDRATGVEEVRSMIDWMAGKGERLQVADCEWAGLGIQCALSVSDGCMEAYGAADGLPGKMTFYSMENGTLRQVVGFLGVAERKAYQTWLETETTWAAEAHADELAQTEGYSKEAGAMAVKLCREYAETLK